MQIKSFTTILLISLIVVNVFTGSDTSVIQLFNKKGLVVNPLCQKRTISFDKNTVVHSDNQQLKMFSNTYCHWCFEISFWKERTQPSKLIKQNTFSYLRTDASVFSDKDYPPPRNVA